MRTRFNILPYLAVSYSAEVDSATETRVNGVKEQNRIFLSNEGLDLLPQKTTNVILNFSCP